MTVRDICRVKIDWMEGFVNDPHIAFILKRDRTLQPWDQKRWQQYGNLFLSDHENEIAYVVHDRNNHNGFGGGNYALHMVQEWTTAEWHDCARREPQWGSGGGSMDVHCHFDQSTRILNIKGPWSGNPVLVQRLTGIECVDVATLEGPRRLTVSSPRYYRQMQRLGRAWDGTAMSTSYRLEFVREVIDTLAPHVELWQGDYGWTVKRRDMPPKNPRRQPRPISLSTWSAEQSMAVFP